MEDAKKITLMTTGYESSNGTPDVSYKLNLTVVSLFHIMCPLRRCDPRIRESICMKFISLLQYCLVLRSSVVGGFTDVLLSAL